MSVPTTGTISEKGLAQERLYGTYGSGDTGGTYFGWFKLIE